MTTFQELSAENNGLEDLYARWMKQRPNNPNSPPDWKAFREYAAREGTEVPAEAPSDLDRTHANFVIGASRQG